MSETAAIAGVTQALRTEAAAAVPDVMSPQLEEMIGMGLIGGGITVFSQLLGMLQQNLNRLPPER